MYAETNLSRFPVEPWATFTNLIFLLVLIYWSVKTKLNYKKHPLISVAMPILGVGFVGGVIYHATRSHRIWLLLDFLPILILVLAASIYLWQMILNNTLLTFICTLGPILLYRLLAIFIEFPDTVYISMGYTALALNILLPAVLHCVLKNPANWKWLFLSGASFVAAIFFRQIDMTWGKMLLQMGTHFFWHLFGGISAFFLIKYLYESDKLIKEDSKESAIKKALMKFVSDRRAQ